MIRSGNTVYQPAYQTTAARIAEFITSHNLQAGDRLPTEQQLSQQLGVSRTVVREAIKVLAATGQVLARKGSGLYVAGPPTSTITASFDISLSVDPVHIHSLFEFRKLLEVHAARLAAQHIGHRTVRELEELVARHKMAANTVNLEIFHDADCHFHLGIAQASQNPFLAASIDKVIQLQDWAVILTLSGVPPGSLQYAAEQHERILLAIKDGDEAAAAQAMHTHLGTVEESYAQEVRRRLRPTEPAV